MLLNRASVAAFFTSLEYPDPQKWINNTDKVMKRLLALPKAIQKEEDWPKDEPSRDLLRDILSALEKGDTLELSAEIEKEPVTDPVPTGPKQRKGKKTVAKKKATTKGTKATKPSKNGKANPNKKDPVAKDKYGNRLGSIHAQICALLTRKPKSMKELLAEAGVEKWQTTHGMNQKAAAGLIGRTEDGYTLPKK